MEPNRMKKEIEVVSPNNDERIHLILTKLAGGLSRETLAEELKYTTYKSLDMYMRRKGYRFEPHLKNYVPQVEELVAPVSYSKASRIIELLSDTPEEPLLVCRKFGFKDMKELGSYMAMKGYQWNTKQNNYKRKPQAFSTTKKESFEDLTQPFPSQGVHGEEDTAIAPYLSLLNILKHNEERLTELLNPFGKGGSIPRYTIAGITQTKTIQMINTLSNLVTEFAKEKNMSQRDLVEVALIDFFRTYGYEKEVVQLLNA